MSLFGDIAKEVAQDQIIAALEREIKKVQIGIILSCYRRGYIAGLKKAIELSKKEIG